jgi:hypothetical protein
MALVLEISRQLLHSRRFSAAILLCPLVVASSVGCNKGKSHVAVAVHSVQGTLKVKGQPAYGAFVSLVPKTAVEGVPTPRAMVNQDGTFTVSTFDGNDGAPEGDYVLTAQWSKPVKQGNEYVQGPSLIAPKFSSPQTSDIKIHVAAGENQLQPILLR